MRSRLPSWVLLLYLTIDLVNPFVPGAFRFTPDEGFVWVEGTPRHREGAGGLAAAAVTAPPPEAVTPERGRVAIREPAPARALGAWLVGVRTSDPPSCDFPPSDSDDH